MIAVIFEVEPREGRRKDYLRMASDLRLMLDQIDGFISIERFQSLSDEGRILSLSFWRDEEAITEWRTLEAHRAAQVVGRAEVFRDYRLRIAHVVRDYGMRARDEAPADSRIAHPIESFRGSRSENPEPRATSKTLALGSGSRFARPE